MTGKCCCKLALAPPSTKITTTTALFHIQIHRSKALYNTARQDATLRQAVHARGTSAAQLHDHHSLMQTQGNPRSIVQLAIAKANNLELETVEVPQPPAADYHKVNSLGKIPSFEGADGFILSETIAIAIYRMSLSSFFLSRLA